jgi:hypothetical protein
MTSSTFGTTEGSTLQYYYFKEALKEQDENINDNEIKIDHYNSKNFYNNVEYNLIFSKYTSY